MISSTLRGNNGVLRSRIQFKCFFVYLFPEYKWIFHTILAIFMNSNSRSNRKKISSLPFETRPFSSYLRKIFYSIRTVFLSSVYYLSLFVAVEQTRTESDDLCAVVCLTHHTTINILKAKLRRWHWQEAIYW